MLQALLLCSFVYRLTASISSRRTFRRVSIAQVAGEERAPLAFPIADDPTLPINEQLDAPVALAAAIAVEVGWMLMSVHWHVFVDDAESLARRAA